jgi:hypothetical protein
MGFDKFLSYGFLSRGKCHWGGWMQASKQSKAKQSKASRTLLG